MRCSKQRFELTPLPLEFELPPEYVAMQNAPKNFIQAVKELPAGTIFSQDTLAGKFPTRTPQGQGTLYTQPEFLRLVKKVGIVNSTRTRGRIALYERIENMEVA